MRSWILIILISFFSFAWAQETNIKASLDTNLISIGDQAHLKIDIQAPVQSELIVPIAQDTLSKSIEIVDWTIDTIKDNPDFQHYLLNYSITSFDSGYYAIPPQMLIEKTSGDTLQTEPILFAVATIAVDTTKQEVFDIKSPVAAPWSLIEFLKEAYPYLLALLGLFIIAGIAFWWWKKSRKKEQAPVKIIVPKEEAHVIALRALAQLKEKKLWQNDRTKEYFIELSEILRNYFENRFQVAAMESTSQEIFELFSSSKMLNDEVFVAVKQVLSLADMAKFAKVKPLAHENDLSLKNAYKIVESTQINEKVVSKEEPSHDA
ncbi:MAG: DUF4381 domain-containing protein [Bacteroidales bacterium]|nr:DUF4381 domain-containing protein [Bacteroidales bacterium]